MVTIQEAINKRKEAKEKFLELYNKKLNIFLEVINVENNTSFTSYETFEKWNRETKTYDIKTIHDYLRW